MQYCELLNDLLLMQIIENMIKGLMDTANVGEAKSLARGGGGRRDQSVLRSGAAGLVFRTFVYH